MKAFKRSIKWALRPATKLARMFFDPRFGSVHAALADQNEEIRKISELATAANDFERTMSTVIGREVGVTRHHLDSIAEIVRSIERTSHLTMQLLQKTASEVDSLEFPLQLAVEDLTSSQAAFLNFAQSHQGFAAQRGLWFNPSITPIHRRGDVGAGAMNERVVEVPFVLGQVATLAAGSRILDVGCCESLVSIELASLGFSVTGLDLRPYPLSHPNLDTIACAIEDWPGPAEPVDAAICLSSIEHFGLGAYGELVGGPNADRDALARIRDWVKPGGLLVLTAPFGHPTTTATMRVYDQRAIRVLLDGWTALSLRYCVRTDQGVWLATQEPPGEADPGSGVVLVTAERS